MEFVKKPVVVDAVLNDKEPVIITTLEGNMTANRGDWIITGVNGEKYPCRADIFEKTYTPVTDEAKAKWVEVYGRNWYG